MNTEPSTEPLTPQAPDTVVLPALPNDAPQTLRLQRDLAVAGLALSRRIPLAEAAGLIEDMMTRAKLGVEQALRELVNAEHRSEATQAKATADRERWSGVHGQTVAGPHSTRLER